MASSKILALLTLAVVAWGNAGAVEPSRILYLVQAGNLAAAIDQYRQHKQDSGNEDLDLIQKMGLALLDQGFRSGDEEIQALTLFGAGICGHDSAQYILEEGIKSAQPQFQLLALNFLSRIHNDDALDSLNRAMTSNYLPIRLEAAFHLAEQKHPKAPGQIEALMQKVPPEALPLFPKLLAASGDNNSIKALRRLLSHPNNAVRVEATLAAAQSGRDDLLPEIRRLSTHFNVAQQEACAAAFGIFKDETSAERLRVLAQSQSPAVKLAALQALCKLGRDDAKQGIIAMAKAGNLFAITALGDLDGSEPALEALARAEDPTVRLNASLALLEHRNLVCLPVVSELLIKDNRDIALTRFDSTGKTLFCWKTIPSARHNFKDNAAAFEVSLALRESILAKAVEMTEEAFLAIAHSIFVARQYDLVPQLTALLQNMQTAKAIELLKLHREQTGAPLVRNYCNLALYRLKEPGPYGDALRTWVASYHHQGLIQFRPYVPWEMRLSAGFPGALMPQDASRFLVDAFESMVLARDPLVIETLLNAIRYGNKKNRYVLAGLLIKATT